MSVSIFDENTPQDGLEFTPFNEAPVVAKPILTASLSGTIDTREIDSFRQGVEISSEAYRFKGLGAKIWAGNIKGYTIIRTIGQAVSFTEYKNDKRFNDLLVKFNPVSFIELGERYPYPLIFNEGPQQNKETSIQPFTIQFRNGKDSNEQTEVAHAVRGALEDGNQNNLKLNGYTDRIAQFIDFYNADTEYSPFLDEGELSFGETDSGSIKIPGFINGNEINIRPFDDNSNSKIYDEIAWPIRSPQLISEFTTEDPFINNPRAYWPPQEYTNGYNEDITGFQRRLYQTGKAQWIPSIASNSGLVVSNSIYGNFQPATSTRKSFQFTSGSVLSGTKASGLESLTSDMMIGFMYKTDRTGSFKQCIMACHSATITNSTEHQTVFSIFMNSSSTGMDFIFMNQKSGSNGPQLAATASLGHVNLTNWNHFFAIRDTSAQKISFLHNGALVNEVTSINFNGVNISPGYYPKFHLGGYETLTGYDHVLSTKFNETTYLSEIKIINYALPPSDPWVLIEYSSSFDIITNQYYQTFSNEIAEALQKNSQSLNIDDDIRGSLYKKSASAGYDVYGPNQGSTGTDSITFNGWFRGN